jgi:hypothetical protein
MPKHGFAALPVSRGEKSSESGNSQNRNGSPSGRQMSVLRTAATIKERRGATCPEQATPSPPI